MAYKALYRAYRPQSFEEVAGQGHIVKTLQNAIKRDKIAHAYLFCGPRGTGKTTIAKILAKAINCEGENVPCNQCPNCIAITEGSHPDVIEIDAASNNGVDEVRELIEKVKYAPINGKYKVYIIDEVHMMSTGAFNALLKTLEEPPSHVVFILATTEPQKILPTIISRCQRFDFHQLTNKDIVDRLKTVLDSENVEYSEEALKLIASLADGGMRDALSITEQCLDYANKIDVESINEIYGMISNEQKISFVNQLITKNIPALLEKMDAMFQTGIDVKRLTTDIINILKDVVIYKNTNDASCLFVLHEEELPSIIPYITSDEALEYIDILLKADQQYKYATNAALYFEIAVLKIANKDHEVQQEKPVIKKKKVIVEQSNVEPVVHHYQKMDEEVKQEPVVESPIIEEEPTVVEVPSNHVAVSYDDILTILVQAKRTVLNQIQEKWSVIRKYTYNLNTAKYASMLCDGKVVAAGDQGFIISFEHQPDVNQVNDSRNYYQLKSFLVEVLGQEYDFIAVTNQEWPLMRKKFVEYKKMNKLPPVGPIKLSHIEKQEEPKEEEKYTEAQKFGLELFGDLVEIKK